MYGLVNIAIRDLISNRFGVASWERIRKRAGVDLEAFVSMNGYPDEITYNLVGATSAEVGIPADQLLEAFGEYWTLFTAERGYGDLLKMGGRTLKDFLLNLHNLHTHVALTFPQLRPPSFWCTEVGEGSLHLHYHSHRPGLAPMVVGLLKGLGKRYETRVEVDHVRRREDGADRDEFRIRFA